MARFITKTVCMALITVLCAGNVFAQGGTYDIVLLANPVVAGVVAGGGTYNDGETATVTAIPAGECWKFIDWTENGIEVSTDAVYTFIVTKDRVLTANFEYGRQGYEITVLANPPQGGTVTGGGIYSCGDVATVTAIPDTCCCYEFVNWTEDDVPVCYTADYEFLVTESRTLVANFERKTFSVTVFANPSYAGTVDHNYTDVPCGDPVIVIATANPGYQFVDWTENDVAVSDYAYFSFEVTSSRVLVANFAGTTAIGEVETSGITVYPNPTSGELKVESGEWSVESVDVFDVFGRNVSRLTSHISHPIPIDISFLPSGIYFVRIQTENGVVTKKIILSER
ncbi:MAG: T9SS type A sorting domain-containing protein [Bacteroidales bacterium]|nr:T9SS type A sorting domain-containing protein [Bacteroidales bacterium]